jgi:hypothetical protein
MLIATPALFSESSRQEYVADPIVTEWLYAALPCANSPHLTDHPETAAKIFCKYLTVFPHV